MSLMTSGVKIWLWPRTSAGGCVSSAITRTSFRSDGLEVVVVVELLAADELLELGRRAEAVDPELALDELGVGVGPLARHAVDAERRDLAARRRSCRRTSSRRGRARRCRRRSWRPRCIMKPVIEPGVAADDDRAALLVDAGARADATLDDEVAAAKRRAGERACVAVDRRRRPTSCSRTPTSRRGPVMWISGPSISPQPK